MAYLLDSVAVILWWADPERLSARVCDIVGDRRERVYVSAVSVWEVANKSRLGKLAMVGDFQREFPMLVARDGFPLLDLNADHAMRAGYLPGAHRDPFDRLLAGQALVEDLTVLTNDPEIAHFGCRTLW